MGLKPIKEKIEENEEFISDLLCRDTARSLPEENFSTRILRKNNFIFNGTISDPEDGGVWAWVYRDHQ